MNGSYLKFLPKRHRLEALEFNDQQKKKRSENTLEDHFKFFFFKYLVSFKIHLTNKQTISDNTIDPSTDIRLIENDILQTYRLVASGIPLPYDYIYDIICKKRFFFPLIELPLYRFVYILEQTKSITRKQFPYSLQQTDYHYFFRTLEGGTMIKAIDIEDESPIVHRHNNKQRIEYTPPRDLERIKYQKCIDIINDTVTNFFSKIGELSKTSPFFQALKEIIRKCASYDHLKVKKTTIGELLSSSKKQKRNNDLDTAKTYVHACKVSGCSLLKQNSDDSIIHVIYLYKNVLEDTVSSEDVFVKVDEKKYNLSFNLCPDHGKIVISIWYLLNIISIITFETLVSIGSVKSTLKAKYSKKTVYEHFCEVTKRENMTKIMTQFERINYSILFVNQWIKHQCLHHL